MQFAAQASVDNTEPTIQTHSEALQEDLAALGRARESAASYVTAAEADLEAIDDHLDDDHLEVLTAMARVASYSLTRVG